MKRCRLDANVLLRFMRNDDPVQSPQARSLLIRAKKGELQLAISVLTVAEVFYALRASYKLPRAMAAEALLRLLQTGAIEVEQEHLLDLALERVIAANVDFGDAMLAAEAVAAGDEVASFDKDFSRFSDVQRYVWKH